MRFSCLLLLAPLATTLLISPACIAPSMQASHIKMMVREKRDRIVFVDGEHGLAQIMPCLWVATPYAG
jgi:hypothetical protein